MRIWLAACAMFLGGCDLDTASNKYPDLTTAKADSGFWLPDFLPESSTNIRTNNQVDLNYSIGSFEFARTDSALLYSRLTPGAAKLPFVDWEGTVRDFKADGYSAWTYREGDETWVFFCAASNDRCEYFTD